MSETATIYKKAVTEMGDQELLETMRDAVAAYRLGIGAEGERPTAAREWLLQLIDEWDRRHG